jgi:hypothetical protein
MTKMMTAVPHPMGAGDTMTKMMMTAVPHPQGAGVTMMKMIMNLVSDVLPATFLAGMR